MGLFDNVKDSIKGSDSQNNGDGFDSSEFDNSFTSDNKGSEMNDDPLGSPQNDQQDFGADPVNGQQNNSSQGRNSLEPSDPLESGNGSSPRQSNDRPQNDFQPENDIRGRGNNDSPNPRAGRPEEGGSQPQLSSDTKKEMEEAGFQMNNNQNNRGRGQRQDRAPGQNRGQQGSVASNRDDFEEIKSQNQQIIELLKRISDALNSGQGGQEPGSGRNRHGGRR